jgi:tetratricopeptide (TPR) repeat protein
MRNDLATRNWIFLALLLGTALSAQALSIGRARAVTIIGKPLDVAIPISLDESEDASQLCPEAEVFFGDDRLGSASVSTSLTRGSAREQVLRIRTNSAVNEPVVSVLVRAGCTQKSQRRFTFLADVETDAAVAGSAPRTPTPLGGGAPESAPLAGNATASGTTATPVLPPSVVRREQRANVVRPNREASAAPAVPRSVVRKEQAPAPQAAAKSERLKVDTFDPLTELIPNLKGSGQMLSQPNEAARAEAAALWRAINAQPGDVLRDAQRLQGLETDVKTLQARAQTTEASVQDVRGQLEQARKERYLNPVVYGLGALLLLCLGGLAYLATRLRNTVVSTPRNDWRQSQEEASSLAGTRSGVRAASIVHPGGKATALNTQETDDDSSDMLALPEHQEFLVDPVQPAASGFGTQRELSNRSVDAEELFDVQQQADFFMSLGQYEQAIEVLQNHISDNVETSALAYLDLLDIYVRLGRRDDYDLLRQDFNRVFNGQVPSFDDYRVDGRGLEAYEGALSRIEQLWNRPQVLEVIEESLFRKPDHDDQAFDLQAYRELLLLYSVAKENAGRVDAHSLDLDLPLEAPSPAAAMAASSLTMMQPLPTDRSMQTTPLSDRDMAAFDRYAQETGQTGDDDSLDIDLDVLDSQLSDLEAEPKAGQAGTGSAWIEFDLDELQPAQRKPRNPE